MDIEITERRDIPKEKVFTLYKANGWSTVEKPDILYRASMNSHSLVTARDGKRPIGLGNAVSDDYLVAFQPHPLVHLDYQGKRTGARITTRLLEKYREFHMQCWSRMGRRWRSTKRRHGRTSLENCSATTRLNSALGFSRAPTENTQRPATSDTAKNNFMVSALMDGL